MVFKGKRALVTGGTGSFGRQAVSELLARGVREVRVFSRDEEKQRQMAEGLKAHGLDPRNGPVRFMLGDVRNADSVARAMRDVDVVFHAAALKQVPTCETNVMETVRTNVLGASNVVEAALESGVERVVAVGTDKAVEPVSVMGMTKALQERLFVEAAWRSGGAGTVFCTVRGGNFLGSRGSVVPLFKRQIEAGGPVTVTSSDITRFVITVREAVALALNAGERAVGGEIFVLEMPAVQLGVLAQAMVDSLAPGNDVGIDEIGLRPGERMYELLVSGPETSRTIRQDSALVIMPELDVRRTFDHYRTSASAGTSLDGEVSSRTARLLTRTQMQEKLQEAGCLA
ncbi:MAG: SDR family NAD(P)-dependent oxidoreductase [Armatimonadota bacterium]|jgi:FlaA1/EpsC-like NDP-sugar epimerase